MFRTPNVYGITMVFFPIDLVVLLMELKYFFFFIRLKERVWVSRFDNRYITFHFIFFLFVYKPSLTHVFSFMIFKTKTKPPQITQSFDNRRSEVKYLFVILFYSSFYYCEKTQKRYTGYDEWKILFFHKLLLLKTNKLIID